MATPEQVNQFIEILFSVAIVAIAFALLDSHPLASFIASACAGIVFGCSFRER